MTRAQTVIHQYIEKFTSGAVSIENVGDYNVKATDKTGKSRTLTINFYCDIIDADTQKIYAISDLPHDLRYIGLDLPTDWKEVIR